MNKPKTKEEWLKWCALWDEAPHEGKVALAQEHNINYGTAKHWRSESTIPVKPKESKPAPPSMPNIDISQVNTPLLLDTGQDMKTIAIIGDTHHPYQDEVAVRLVEEFLEETQPDYLIYNGDINDFYQVSVFAKDPSRLASLQDDLDMTTAMFERHEKILPNTKKILIVGTHEDRWRKYQQQQSPATANLRANTIPGLYNLDKYDIGYVDFERGVLINGIFLVLHGNIVSVHSSYTAKRHYEKHGGCGMCNHTHRGGSYYKRDRFGTWGWWENFCLCRLDPDWVQNPDWQQGFSLVHFNGGSRFWVEQIPIIGKSFIYGGKVYK